MSARALRFSIVSFLFVPFTLALHGCGGPPADSGALAREAALDFPEAEADEVAAIPITETAPNDLASLAQRDVDDFMRLRREAEAKTQASPENTDSDGPQPGPAESEPVAAAPPAIIWTDPVGQSLASAEDAEALTATPTESAITMGASTPDDDSPNPVLAIHQPLDTLAPEDRLNELLVGLSAELYMRASDADQPLRELIMITATSMVDPSRKLANIDALPGLTDREREMLTAFQSFFLELGSKLDGSEEADSAVITALQALQSSLVEAPILTIPAASLCTSVEGFGKYAPFSENRFLAHADQQMVVYVEIGDFSCTQNPAGQWVTELAQQLIIYSDRDGIPVWREEWLPVVDTASKPRQDFYTTQLVTLPDALSVGKYQLKIRLRDEHSGAEAEQAIEFEMVADPKLAAGR